jgi:hypothetical protein
MEAEAGVTTQAPAPQLPTLSVAPTAPTKPPPPLRATNVLPNGEFAVTWTWQQEIIYALLYRSQVDADLGRKAINRTGDPKRLVEIARMYA